MAKSLQSQKQMIKEALIRGERITQLEAYGRFDCTRLSGRICDLRDEGLNIITEMIKTKSGKRIAEYHIEFPKGQGELFLI